MGGTQSLHTNSKDEALWLPTPQSVTTALRTQQIIAEETGAADSVDPLAGSYLVEYLTDEISTRAMEYIQKIDAMGGALAAIERGYMQSEIQEAAYRFQKSVESGERTVVGVNKYQSAETVELERLKVDPKIELDQTAETGCSAGREGFKQGKRAAHPSGEGLENRYQPDAAVDRMRGTGDHPGRDLPGAARELGRIPGFIVHVKININQEEIKCQH